MAKSKIVELNKYVETKVTNGYKKIEDTTVGTFENIENKFIDRYLLHENETTEEAKERLKKENEQKKSDHLQHKTEHIEGKRVKR